MTAVLRRYFRGRKLNTMEDVVAGKKYVYHFDHQGSTQALTDATTGAVTDRFASDAWGVQVKRTGTSLNRNWYLGDRGFYRQVDHLHDYAVQRYYEPLLATMISPSVAGQSGGYWAPIPATANVSGIACSPAGCPIHEFTDLLNAQTIRMFLDRVSGSDMKCNPTKLSCTMELLRLISKIGGFWGKPISSRLLRHWLSGQNHTYPIPFSRLLRDRNFKRSYDYILSEAVKRACKSTSFVVRDTIDPKKPKEFESGSDLFYSLHQYELSAHVTVTRTGIGCNECHNGEVSKIEIRFPFTDRYDWSPNEATDFPFIGRFRQVWAIDLSDCCNNCCRDFTVVADQTDLREKCCPKK